MPPKRKTPLAVVDTNETPPAKKISNGKTAVRTASSASTAWKTYKYCDPSTIAHQDPVDVIFCIWPGLNKVSENGSEDDHHFDEANQIKPKNVNAELDKDGDDIPKKSHVSQTEADAKQAKKAATGRTFVSPRAVTEIGFPISKAAWSKMLEIESEVEKRDPEMHGMHISNDFAGYGVTEVMENVIVEFNKIIFKKDVSPLDKWTTMEALTIYFYMGEHTSWMMNDDSEAVNDCLNIIGVMFITVLEMLHESELIGPESPLPDNVGIMTLIFLEFMTHTCSDFELGWCFEVVRAADTYGVVLSPVGHINFDQDELIAMREECEQARITKGLNWKTAYTKFRRNHAGGRKLDITKMSKNEKSQYRFDNIGLRLG